MTKKKYIEIFKALRIIITIMLFCAKTNKTVRTGGSISPFTTTETRKKIKTTISLSTLG